MLLTSLAFIVLGQKPTLPQKPEKKAPEPLQVFEPQWADTLPAEALNWSGWKYAHTSPPKQFQGALKPESTTGESVKAPVKWRVKFVLLNRVDYAVNLGAGSVHLPSSLGAWEHRMILQSLVRATQLVKVMTKGQVQLVPDLEEENGNLKGDVDELNRQASWITQSRFNLGVFNADDNFYRGPFQHVVFLHNCPAWESVGSAFSTMPVTETTKFSTHRLETRIAELFARNVNDLHSAAWNGATFESNDGAPNFKFLTQRATESPTVEEEHGLSGWLKDQSAWLQSAFYPVALTKDATAAVIPDAAKGSVLRLGRTTDGFAAGWSLPSLPAGTKFVKLTLRSSTGEPFLFVTGDQKWSFGSAYKLPGHLPERWTSGISLTPGAWQTVIVPAWGTQISIQTGSSEALRSIPGRFDSSLLDLADVTPVDEAALLVESTNPENPIAVARALFAESTTKQKLIEDIKSSPAVVREAAAVRLGQIKDIEVEQALIKATLDINPLVGEAAVRSLNLQESETSSAFVRRAARAGASERLKAVAVSLIKATVGDTSLNTMFATLSASRSWQTRLAVVEAMGLIKEENTQRLRLTMLLQPEAEIRRLILSGATISNKEDASRVLYSAVNDPSDSVRIAAYTKLFQSEDEKILEQANQFWQDESWAVSLKLVEAGLAQKSLAKGLKHSSPFVRAATLAAWTKEMNPTDLSAVAMDKDPRVQLALIRTSRLLGIPLSDQAKQNLSSSPFTGVKTALGAK